MTTTLHHAPEVVFPAGSEGHVIQPSRAGVSENGLAAQSKHVVCVFLAVVHGSRQELLAFPENKCELRAIRRHFSNVVKLRFHRASPLKSLLQPDTHTRCVCVCVCVYRRQSIAWCACVRVCVCACVRV